MTKHIRGIDVLTLACTVYGEARGTSQRDREDVAQVIVNRYRHGPAWMKSQRGDGIPDHTIEATCRDPWQFSCWNDNDPNYPLLRDILDRPTLSLGDRAFRNCLTAAMDVLAGRHLNRTNGALHYHSEAIPFPPAWGDPREPDYENGHHLFYVGID